MSTVVLFVIIAGLMLAALAREFRKCFGCCSTCDGDGGGISDPVTNGLCWDCRATGHGVKHHRGADQ